MASLPTVAPIPVLKSSYKGALYKDILQVAQKDYLFVLRGIASQEVGEQISVGNKPTAQIVDGRKGKGIDEATRSVVVWFADRKTLAAAIVAAHDALVANGRSVHGHTLGALRYYKSEGKAQRVTPCDPMSTAQTVSNPAALDLYVSIAAPHVRKWQWLSKAGKRLMRKTRNKKLVAYARAHGKPRQLVQMSVFEKSAKQVQTRFPSVDVKDIYLRVGNLNAGGHTPVDRIPAIKVCMKIAARV